LNIDKSPVVASSWYRLHLFFKDARSLKHKTHSFSGVGSNETIAARVIKVTEKLLILRSDLKFL
jgi:hypothetical protein